MYHQLKDYKTWTVIMTTTNHHYVYMVSASWINKLHSNPFVCHIICQCLLLESSHTYHLECLKSSSPFFKHLIPLSESFHNMIPLAYLTKALSSPTRAQLIHLYCLQFNFQNIIYTDVIYNCVNVKTYRTTHMFECTQQMYQHPFNYIMSLQEW